MKHKTKRILTLLTAVVLVLALPVIGASAADLTFGTDGKVTNTTDLQIYIGPYTDTSGYYADIKTVAVTVDLYKVADAVHEPSGQDHGSMYVFSPASSDFNTILQDTTSYDGLKDLSNTDWQAMAQSLAGKVFGNNPPSLDKVTLQAAAGDGITASTNVGAGLYLVIAHGTALGNDASKYVEKDELNNVKTKAESDHYVYYYTPELIALPTTAATVGVPVNSPADTQPAGTYNNPLPTTAGGDWQTEVTALLKPTRTYRMGKLAVQKYVPAIEEHSDATFVFHVIAELERSGNRDTLIDDYYSISFGTNDGGKTIAYYDPVTQLYYIELPVGTEVTVEEVYPGSCYEFAGQTWSHTDGDGKHVIPVPIDANGNDVVLVTTVTNVYIPNDLHIGYGIQNTFGLNGSSWVWYKDGQPMNGGTK